MYTEITETKRRKTASQREDKDMKEENITTSTGMQNVAELLYLAALLLGGLLTAVL